MATTQTNKIQTRQAPKTSDIQEAYVVANYGDLGLTQNYFFDILSRFIIVATVPHDRLPTVGKYKDILKLVLRPRSLWIDVDGALPISGNDVIPSSLRRVDAKGNINVGSGANSALNSSIPIISPNYTLGQKITIRKLNKVENQRNIEIFRSAFPSTMLATHNEYSDYSEGLPDVGYITPTFEDQTRAICLARPSGFSFEDGIPTYYTPPTSSGPGSKAYVNSSPPYASDYAYVFRLWKYQYELFMRHMFNAAPEHDALLQVFNDTAYSGRGVMQSTGGYVFKSQSYIDFSTVGWEEIAPARTRVDGLDCQPLIVTSPNSFVTPSRRETGTIVYDPTYQTIISS